MDIDTRAAAVSLLAFKYEAAGKEWSENLEDGYIRLLQPLDNRFGMHAVQHAVATCMYLTEIIATILRRHAELISPLPSSDVAWQEVHDKMGRMGRQRISHPLVSATVRELGGLDQFWHEYRHENKPISLLRSRFVKSYEARVENHYGVVIALVSQHGCVEGARQAAPHLFYAVPTTLQLSSRPLPEIAPMRPEECHEDAQREDERRIAADTVARLKRQLRPDTGDIVEAIAKPM